MLKLRKRTLGLAPRLHLRPFLKVKVKRKYLGYSKATNNFSNITLESKLIANTRL